MFLNRETNKRNKIEVRETKKTLYIAIIPLKYQLKLIKISN